MVSVLLCHEVFMLRFDDALSMFATGRLAPSEFPDREVA
jgi:hypothetical protein